MPFFHGPMIAGPDVSPASWTHAFEPRRAALVLAPGCASGWFGGVALVGCDAPLVRTIADESPAYASSAAVRRAAALLENAYRSRRPVMAVALLSYDGSLRAAVFERGLARTVAGWRLWGDWAGVAAPEPVPVSALGWRDRLVQTDAAAEADRVSFLAGVGSARAAMCDGDLYVVNLCRRLRGLATSTPAVTFATLVARSDAAMAACWCTPGHALVSASPERFLRLDRRLLVVEPVKGTRPRSNDPRRDAELKFDLLSSVKERAEHVMVVDLERNDIGRVAVPGSVVVSPLMRLMETPYCHQLVSSVGGLVGDGVSLKDVLSATFPCGSVTGAPKRAAMEHIRRSEGVCRGEYTGSLVVAVPGRIDSSVLIRTAVIEDGVLSYGVGAGITVDSDPMAEWEETVTKASPLFRASGRR